MRPVWSACATLACAIGLSNLAAPAAAQDADAAIAATLDCRSIGKPGPRLDCFDKAAEALAALRPVQALSVSPRSEPILVPRAAPLSPAQAEAEFGAEQIEAVRREREAQLPKRIAAPVKAFRREPNGATVFELENGQVWRQAEADNTTLFLRPSRSYSLEIKRGLMGGYMATVPELKRSLRVERIK